MNSHDPRWREALQLWLAWNEAYQLATSQAYASGGDLRQLEELMDRMDQIRERAVALSQQLLENVPDEPRSPH